MAPRLPPDAADYDRIVLIFDGEDEDAVAAARTCWADVKAKGFDVTYWQRDEQGRWVEKGLMVAAAAMVTQCPVLKSGAECLKPGFGRAALCKDIVAASDACARRMQHHRL